MKKQVVLSSFIANLLPTDAGASSSLVDLISQLLSEARARQVLFSQEFENNLAAAGSDIQIVR